MDKEGKLTRVTAVEPAGKKPVANVVDALTSLTAVMSEEGVPNWSARLKAR